MDLKTLKVYLYENNTKLEDMLEEVGYHSIKYNNGSPDDFLTFANVDGDNTTAITLYLNPSLKMINYTRDIEGGDLFSLLMYEMKITLRECVKFIMDYMGIDKDFLKKEKPKALDFLDRVNRTKKNEMEIKKLDALDISELNNYRYVAHKMFVDDNISAKTQYKFGIHYDYLHHSIIIPIFDEDARLISMKARRVKPKSWESKYVYTHNTEKSQILYGLHITKEDILYEGCVYLMESEKAVLQLYDQGIKNAVSIGGHKISAVQAMKLRNLGVDIIIAFDKDVPVTKKFRTQLDMLFPKEVKLGVMYDKEDILECKESPSDNISKFLELRDKCIIWRK